MVSLDTPSWAQLAAGDVEAGCVQVVGQVGLPVRVVGHHCQEYAPQFNSQCYRDYPVKYFLVEIKSIL